jgi:hypothetical protein
VGFAAGGGSDFIARLLALKLTEKLGQTVIVENKPGAGGNLAAGKALKSPADGCTLFLTAASCTVNPALYKLSFDPIKDMTPIAQLARGPFIIAVNPAIKVKSLKGFAELAKKQPGKQSFASAGNGSIVHMVTEYFLDSVGADVLHIPYKGTFPALSPPACARTPGSRSRPCRCSTAHPPWPPPGCVRCATRWGCSGLRSSAAAAATLAVGPACATWLRMGRLSVPVRSCCLLHRAAARGCVGCCTTAQRRRDLRLAGRCSGRWR